MRTKIIVIRCNPYDLPEEIEAYKKKFDDENIKLNFKIQEDFLKKDYYEEDEDENDLLKLYLPCFHKIDYVFCNNEDKTKPFHYVTLISELK